MVTGMVLGYPSMTIPALSPTSRTSAPPSSHMAAIVWSYEVTATIFLEPFIPRTRDTLLYAGRPPPKLRAMCRAHSARLSALLNERITLPQGGRVVQRHAEAVFDQPRHGPAHTLSTMVTCAVPGGSGGGVEIYGYDSLVGGHQRTRRGPRLLQRYQDGVRCQ